MYPVLLLVLLTLFVKILKGQPENKMVLIASIKVPLYSAIAGCSMIACMFFTYYTCVHQQECPALPKLPTISNTFDNPPGNFVSRFVISHVALAMSLCQWAIWTPLASTNKYEKLFLNIGLLSIFCFSIVGAICDDDTNPQCRGNNTFHSVSAVTFFVLYNMNMVIITCSKKKKNKSARCCSSDVLLVVLSVLSMASKVRWFLPSSVLALGGLGDQTPLAIIEWSDVFLIIGWTILYCGKHARNYELHYRTEDSTLTTTTGEVTVIRFNVRTITLAVTVLSVGTLVMCYYYIKKQGRVPAGSWPMISDMFVYPPGNWISRWTLVFGSTLTIFAHVCLYHLDGRTTIGDKALTVLSVIACLGLSVVGCVNEKENNTIHLIGAGIFFCGYDLFMVLRSLRHVVTAQARSTFHRYNALQIFLAILSCVCSVLRFTEFGQSLVLGVGSSMGNVGNMGKVIVPVIEWIDTVTILSYMTSAVLSHGKKNTEGIGLAIVQTTAEEEEEDDNEKSLPLTSSSLHYNLLI